MSKECTVPGGEVIAKGDAVCVTGFDVTHNRPIIERATRINLANSKTVFGVAEGDSVAGNDGEAGSVVVLVTGEVAGNAITSLGNGGRSHIVVTAITKSDLVEEQCRLQRLDSPMPISEGFVVGTCDENGNLTIQPTHSSYETGFLKVYNVRAYGAVLNWNGTEASDDGTANLAAFKAALTAMRADGNKSAILVADGHFYLSDTLHIRQTVVFEGRGRNEPEGGGGVRSWPGTWLVFPRDCDGIRLHSSADGLGGGAEFSALRNLTISCKESRPPHEWPPEVKGDPPAARPPLPGQTGHGVRANCFFRAENVTVENFGEHGFFISAGGDPPADPGNASGFVLDSCVIGLCGGDGVHVIGNDASVSLIANCNASGCWGWGFWDESSAGNTYLTCIGQGNLGETEPDGGFTVDRRNHDYKSVSDVYPANASTFLACYTEAAHNKLSHNSGAFGGLMGQGGGLGLKGRGFYLSPGGGEPLAYEYRLAYEYQLTWHSLNLMSVLRADELAAMGKSLVIIALVSTDLHIRIFDASGRKVIDTGEQELRQKLKDRKPPEQLDTLEVLKKRLTPFPDILALSDADKQQFIREATFIVDYILVATFGTRTVIGNPDDPNRALTIMRTRVKEPSWLTYNSSANWWDWLNGGENRIVFRLPTVTNNVRSPAMWLPNGVFLGDGSNSGADAVQQLHLAAPSPVETQASGEPLTYERGDVVWKSDPAPGGPLGHVCIEGGTRTNLVGFQTKDAVAQGATTLTLNKVLLPFGGLFSPGQRIVIDGSVYTITGASLDPANPPEGQIEITPGTVVPIPAGASVTFKRAEFAQFGRVEIIGSTIDPVNNYEAQAGERVVVTTAGRTVKLPTKNPPLDGDVVEVLNMSGGNATVDAGANRIYAAGGSTLTLGDDMKKTFMFIGDAVAAWKAS
jgi:hypothetical protein